MANRIPLIVDRGDSDLIKELPVGDNLDLENSGIVNAGNIECTSITLNGSSLNNFSGSFNDLSGKPTTLAGYGITDGFDGAFSSLSGKPTTIAGYGITDSPSSLADLGITDNGVPGQVLRTDGAGNYSFVTVTGLYAEEYDQQLNTTNDVQFNSITGPLTGNVIGNVTGNVIGNVTGNVTGNAAGDHTGSFVGPITATGTLDGDLTGSVFADDSTPIVDGINRNILANDISANNGNFTNIKGSLLTSGGGVIVDGTGAGSIPDTVTVEKLDDFINDFKAAVAASTDLADFQSRIAALAYP